MDIQNIEDILNSELMGGDYAWALTPYPHGFLVFGDNGAFEIMLIMLAGFPYAAFGSVGLSGLIPFASADETKARSLIRGMLANVTK